MNFSKNDALERLFRRIDVRDNLSGEEREALLEAAGEIRTLPAGSRISSKGEELDRSTLLVSGIAARTVYTEMGHRQITAFHIAGDFVDLHAFPLKIMDHNVEAITACEVIHFPHPALRQITERHSHLTRVLWLLTLLDSAIHRQWLAVMGQLQVTDHLAHLLCEQFTRAKAVGLAAGNAFPFPITQQDLADAMGRSVVHVNRTLQGLRRQDLIEWQGGDVTILDWPALQELAEFDPAYLHLERLPR